MKINVQKIKDAAAKIEESNEGMETIAKLKRLMENGEVNKGTDYFNEIVFPDGRGLLIVDKGRVVNQGNMPVQNVGDLGNHYWAWLESGRCGKIHKRLEEETET